MVKDDFSTWVEVEQVSHKFRIGYHPDFHKHAIQRHGFFFAGLGIFIGQPDHVRFAEHRLRQNIVHHLDFFRCQDFFLRHRIALEDTGAHEKRDSGCIRKQIFHRFQSRIASADNRDFFPAKKWRIARRTIDDALAFEFLLAGNIQVAMPAAGRDNDSFRLILFVVSCLHYIVTVFFRYSSRLHSRDNLNPLLRSQMFFKHPCKLPARNRKRAYPVLDARRHRRLALKMFRDEQRLQSLARYIDSGRHPSRSPAYYDNVIHTFSD